MNIATEITNAPGAAPRVTARMHGGQCSWEKETSGAVRVVSIWTHPDAKWLYISVEEHGAKSSRACSVEIPPGHAEEFLRLLAGNMGFDLVKRTA